MQWTEYEQDMVGIALSMVRYGVKWTECDKYMVRRGLSAINTV